MSKEEIIRTLNDDLRKNGRGGIVVCTQLVNNSSNKNKIFSAVRNFSDFNEGNDPYNEHDFGKITVDGEDYFWKIDYYSDATYTYASEDPSDPEQTKRVLTIMNAEEY